MDISGAGAGARASHSVLAAGGGLQQRPAGGPLAGPAAALETASPSTSATPGALTQRPSVLDLAGSRSFSDTARFPAMRSLLQGIAAERGSGPAYRNPWAGLEDSQVEQFAQGAIKGLTRIRDRDLSVAVATHMEAQESAIPAEQRVQLLQWQVDQLKAESGYATQPATQFYVRELQREIQVLQKALQNREQLAGRPADQLAPMNLRTAHLGTGEQPGKVRIYMAVFAPSESDAYKDLQKNRAGGLEARSNQLWIGIGTPARALSWAQQYRLNGASMPLIRTMLVDRAFLEQHLPGAVTEQPEESGQALVPEIRADARQVKGTAIRPAPLMNVDVKTANQFGLPTTTDKFIYRTGAAEGAEARVQAAFDEGPEAFKRSRKPDDRNAEFKDVQPVPNEVWEDLLAHVDPASFETIASSAEFGELHSPSRDGPMQDQRVFANSIGLAGGPDSPVMNLLESGPEGAATAFHIQREGKWQSMSGRELGEVVNRAQALFEELDAVGDPRLAQAATEAERRAALAGRLGDLLEANRLTPGALLPTPARLDSRQRDRDGNSAVKTHLEQTFAERYLTGNAWHQDMAQWSLRLSQYLRDHPGLVKENNQYSQKDLRALGAGRAATNAADRTEATCSELQKLSEQLAAADRRGLDAADPQQLRRVALFFHLLRDVAQGQTIADPPQPVPHAVAGADPAKVEVNNRNEVVNAHDVLNPAAGPFGWPADRMQSAKRFVPAEGSAMTRYMAQLDAPFIGGVSGTTRDITKAMNTVFGAMPADAYWKFQLLNAAFMAKSGYHSMFESLYVAARYDPSPRGQEMLNRLDQIAADHLAARPDAIYTAILANALGDQGQRLWGDAVAASGLREPPQPVAAQPSGDVPAAVRAEAAEPRLPAELQRSLDRLAEMQASLDKVMGDLLMVSEQAKAGEPVDTGYLTRVMDWLGDVGIRERAIEHGLLRDSGEYRPASLLTGVRVAHHAVLAIVNDLVAAGRMAPADALQIAHPYDKDSLGLSMRETLGTRIALLGNLKRALAARSETASTASETRNLRARLQEAAQTVVNRIIGPKQEASPAQELEREAKHLYHDAQQADDLEPYPIIERLFREGVLDDKHSRQAGEWLRRMQTRYPDLVAAQLPTVLTGDAIPASLERGMARLGPDLQRLAGRVADNWQAKQERERIGELERLQQEAEAAAQQAREARREPGLGDLVSALAAAVEESNRQYDMRRAEQQAEFAAHEEWKASMAERERPREDRARAGWGEMPEQVLSAIAQAFGPAEPVAAPSSAAAGEPAAGREPQAGAYRNASAPPEEAPPPYEALGALPSYQQAVQQARPLPSAPPMDLVVPVPSAPPMELVMPVPSAPPLEPPRYEPPRYESPQPAATRVTPSAPPFSQATAARVSSTSAAPVSRSEAAPIRHTPSPAIAASASRPSVQPTTSRAQPEPALHLPDVPTHEPGAERRTEGRRRQRLAE